MKKRSHVPTPKNVDEPPPGGTSRWMAGILFAAAWIVPWLALSGLGRASWFRVPAPAEPFGFQQVLLVHLAGILGFVFWAASWLTRLSVSGRAFAGIAVAIGLMVAGLSVFLRPAVHAWSESLTFVEKDVLRLVWVFALQLPWAVACCSWVPVNRWWFKPNRVDAVIAALVALLPAMHADQVAARHALLVGEALAYNQYVEARDIGQRLITMGVSTLQGQPARALVELQTRRVERLQELVAEPLSRDALEADRLDRARQHFGLGQVTEARQLLVPLEDEFPEALLYQGMASELQRAWRDAAGYYRRAVDRLRKLPDDEEKWRRMRAALERYANNLRRAGDPLAAEQMLLQGLRDWPPLKSFLLLQLAYHYQMAGRIWESQDYFRLAGQADPSVQAEVDLQLSKLDIQAQGCILRPTRGASR